MNYILTIYKDILYAVGVGIDNENTVTIVIDCWKNMALFISVEYIIAIVLITVIQNDV